MFFSSDSFEKGHFTENTRGEVFYGRTVGQHNKLKSQKNSWYERSLRWDFWLLRLRVQVMAKMDPLASRVCRIMPA